MGRIFTLFLAFALIIATLQPSAAIRTEVFKPNQDASEKIAASSTTNSDVAQPSIWPGFPGLPPFPRLPPLPPFPNLPTWPEFPPFPSFPLFPPLPPRSPSAPAPGTPSPPSPSTPQPTECRSSLMELMPCKDYLTNTSTPVPPNPGPCCDGFKSLVSNAPVCLCHAWNGDINKLMPAPVDFVNQWPYLPIACDVILPVDIIANCNTEPVPPLMPAPTPEAPTPEAAPSSKPSS